MSSNQKEPELLVEKPTSGDIEAELSTSVVNKSKSMETSEHNTSVESIEKKVVKKKRSKTSSHPNKKMKKDPNKPEYPKVGMYKGRSL